MQTYMTNDQLRGITRLAKSKLEAGELLVIKPESVLHLLKDLSWRQMSESEYKMYLEECQEIIMDIRELADWEDDEWDAVKRLGNIRERLGMK